MAGRTKSMKVSIEATGLPGRPKKCADPIRPTASGRPGCIATCQNSIAPISSRTSLTRSYRPTDTPPDVTTTSPVAPASARRAERVAEVGDDAEVHDLAAALLDGPAEGEPVRVVDLARLAQLTRLDHLVTRRQEHDTRPTVHGHLDLAERGDQA